MEERVEDGEGGEGEEEEREEMREWEEWLRKGGFARLLNGFEEPKT